MSRSVKALNIVIFSVWILLIFLLLYRNHTGGLLEKTQALKGVFHKSVYWYDIYSGSKKIGFASRTYEKAGDDIVLKVDQQVNVVNNGRKTVLFQNLKCLCNPDYSIKSFEFSSHFAEEKGLEAKGEAGPDSMLLFIESSGLKKPLVVSTHGKRIYLPATFVRFLAKQTPTPNSAFSTSILDLEDFKIKEIRVALTDILPQKFGTDAVGLFKFQSNESIWWVNQWGNIVKEFDPLGITFYAESEKLAEDFSDRLIFDSTELPAIKSDKLIPDPEKLTRLKVRIRGLTLDSTLYRDGRTKLENGTLVIEKENIADPTLKAVKIPYGGTTLRRYIEPDTWVVSDFKPLMDTGRIYARTNDYSGYNLTGYLTSYVFNLINRAQTFFLYDSRDIFKTLTGDYLEKTVMFATYARAGGLPTRLVGGLVYVHGYFYFHTWPEVWLDRWVPADPTFYQFPADVTHIPLREGTLKDITSIASDLNKVSIEVLEAL